jgi:predicted  nucleic acid-binding Zn-ribbon protein
MHPAIPHLVDVQAADQQIAALRAGLEALPKRIREADAQLAASRAEVASAKEAHAANLRERKKLDLDAAQWKERARKYREQTGAVKTNEAYKALLLEIANAEAESAKAEDAELEVMMAGDELDRRVKSAEARLREAEAAVAAERKKMEAQGADQKRQLEAAIVAREKAIAPVSEDLRELYERIAKRHHGLALARVRDGQCQGCGLRILPHVVQMLHRDQDEEIFRCESCGLILYSLEPVPAKAPSGSGDSAASAQVNG